MVSKVKNIEIKKKIMDLIEEHNILSYGQLIDFLRGLPSNRYFEVASSDPSFFVAYLESKSRLINGSDNVSDYII